MDSASGAIRRLFGSRGYSNGQQNLSGLFLNLNTVSYHYWTITAYHSLNEYDQIGGNTAALRFGNTQIRHLALLTFGKSGLNL